MWPRCIGCLILLAGVLPVPLAWGQTMVHGFFSVAREAGMGTGGLDAVTVRIQLQAQPETELGSASLRLIYDPAVLALPSGAAVNADLVAETDYVYHDYHTQFVLSTDPVRVANYSDSNATRTRENELSINIVLASTNIGKLLPAALTDVVSLTFDLLDAGAAQTGTPIAWITGGSNPTEVFQADNLTLLQNGDFSGDLSALAVARTEEGALPERLQLAQNYPNPFNPTTTIRYALPHRAKVQVLVYDVLGRRVAVLVDATQAAGVHAIPFTANNLAGGLYFYRLIVGNVSQTRSMLLLK